ncbi:MAG: PTS glucose transporter subunit IIA [Collinsella sp.]
MSPWCRQAIAWSLVRWQDPRQSSHGCHAVAVHTVEGLDVLIHVGLETVKLDGRHFKVETPLSAIS